MIKLDCDRNAKPPATDNPTCDEQARKLSWEDTFRAMASEAEDWSDFDAALSDGID